MGDDRNDLGLSRRHLTRALEASLRRLRVDCVDLYQVHAWDPLTPVEETLGFFDDAVRAGKVRYAGLSNYAGWQVQKAVDVAEHRHLPRPVTLQPQYNLLSREIEWEIVPACLENGLGLLPWSPLGGGWLTGKYTRDQRPERRHPARGGPGARRGGVRQAGRQRADLGRGRRRPGRRRGVRGADGLGGAVVGARPAGGLLGHPGRPHHRAAHRQPVRRRRAPDEATTAALDAASDPSPADYPYGPAGLEQRTRTV